MFTNLDRISLPGSPERANEDSFGVAGEFAWVIDTSIFPGTPPIMNESSDAAWLAGFTSERLASLALEAIEGPELLRAVMTEARDRFFEKAPADRHDFMSWPVGAMTLVRRSGDMLDVWTFADTTAFVRPPREKVRTVGEAPEMRKFEMAKAAELLKASGCTPATIGKSDIFRDWLGGRRERQKQTGAMALLGLDPEAAFKMRHACVPCPDGTDILLTSDGFSALVDLYGRLDADALMEAAFSRGLAALAGEARAIETDEDPEGRLYPRFKTSDDATALLLRA